jgi:hypothetical protein
LKEEPMRLKISKTQSGTYYIPSLSIKQIKKLAEKYKRRWSLKENKSGLYLKLEGE